MTLAQKIVLRNVLLLVGLTVLGGISLWGLLALRDTVHTALNENAELRRFETVRERASDARRVLTAAVPDYIQAQGNIKESFRALQMYGDDGTQEAEAGQYADWERGVKSKLFPALTGALENLSSPDKTAGATNTQARVAQLDDVVLQTDQAISQCQGFIRATHQRADNQLRTTLISISLLSALIFAIASWTGVTQYRSVIRPLRSLQSGVRTVANGNFTERLETTGDPEYSALAVEFNRMAEQLDEFYHRLEEKVRQKSQELVRSQRLASVGFLAAGVAHEINNPLNIISGYSELTLKRLDRGYDEVAASEVEESLRIIKDEAFRCKLITTKLLSMSRGSEARESFSLARVAKDVAKVISGLESYQSRQIDLCFANGDELLVLGNVSEIKQALLNLTVNALEAVKPDVGRVSIEGRRNIDWVEISVCDNGRGMTPETIERVFEPFYTEKRGVGEPGTGLGLSITHAIVRGHGGTIEAQSDGLGKGSRFTIKLPAHEKAGAHATT